LSFRNKQKSLYLTKGSFKAKAKKKIIIIKKSKLLKKNNNNNKKDYKKEAARAIKATNN